MTLNTSCYVCSYIHILRYTFHSIVCSCSVMKNYSRVFYNFKELSSCVCIRSCNSNCEQSCRCCPTCLPPLHAPRSWHVTLTQAIILQWLFLSYLDSRSWFRSGTDRRSTWSRGIRSQSVHCAGDIWRALSTPSVPNNRPHQSSPFLSSLSPNVSGIWSEIQASEVSSVM